MSRETKAALATPAQPAALTPGELSELAARLFTTAMAARAATDPTDVEVHAAAEFQRVKAELRTIFE